MDKKTESLEAVEKMLKKQFPTQKLKVIRKDYTITTKG